MLLSFNLMYNPLKDILLCFSADERLEEHRDALCQIENTGLVIWLPQAVYKSSCEIDVSAFPFDIQNCHLKFGSWTYDQSKVDLELLGNTEEIDRSEYMVSNAWHILSAPAKRNEVSYSCCPEQYVDLTFRLIFQRRSVLYNYILILPCILLTSLTLVLFWIPPESPAKLMLGRYHHIVRRGVYICHAGWVLESSVYLVCLETCQHCISNVQLMIWCSACWVVLVHSVLLCYFGTVYCKARWVHLSSEDLKYWFLITIRISCRIGSMCVQGASHDARVYVYMVHLLMVEFIYTGRISRW